ncbi:uncharacterized protein TrAFT101_001162 [Trichoderma asperellum]|uniref:uncharacterized protein n=1 Tax=Trichoderma asperellum TaxID=101201 RepID=UPI003320C4AA|nr:hypothetical protein TrAFT101_001162 [Trichoderma asperellum]
MCPAPAAAITRRLSSPSALSHQSHLHSYRTTVCRFGFQGQTAFVRIRIRPRASQPCSASSLLRPADQTPLHSLFSKLGCYSIRPPHAENALSGPCDSVNGPEDTSDRPPAL